MAVAVGVSLGDEQEGVDHLVEQRADDVVPRAELEQRLAEADLTEAPSPLVAANPGAQRHALAPADGHRIQLVVKVLAVVEVEQGEGVGCGVQQLGGVGGWWRGGQQQRLAAPGLRFLFLFLRCEQPRQLGIVARRWWGTVEGRGGGRERGGVVLVEWEKDRARNEQVWGMLRRREEDRGGERWRP